MKKLIIQILFLAGCLSLSAAKWTPHFAYNDISLLTITPDEVFVLSGGNVFSVQKQTEQLHFYTSQDGLTGNSVSHMLYDAAHDALLLFYGNGYLDIKTDDGVYTVSDLYLKQMTAAKSVQGSYQDGDCLYLAMPYGVQTYSLSGREFVDTYYIGPEASEVNVLGVTASARTLYAMTDSLVYYASMDSNLVDFRYWHTLPRVEGKGLRGLAALDGSLMALWDNHLYSLTNGIWQLSSLGISASALYVSNGHVLATSTTGGIYDLSASRRGPVSVCTQYAIAASAYDAASGDYWLAGNTEGAIHVSATSTDLYPINSPIMNMPYRMRYTKDKLFVVPGSRWALQSNRPGYIMMYENGVWSNVTFDRLNGQAGFAVRDLMDAAADTADLNHYFVASYGNGLFEMYKDTIRHRYWANNSGLYDASEADPQRYTRVDGLLFDKEGNLWMANAGKGLKVLRPDSSWLTFTLEDIQHKEFAYPTPDRPVFDPVHAGRIWYANCRNAAGLGLVDWGGTLTDPSDDRTLFRSQFLTEDGSSLEFEKLFCSMADLDGNIWLGTEVGLYYFPATEDFFTSSLLLQLGVMPGDADVFLKDEQINDIVVDDQNRKWIATNRLGVYVLSADNRTIEHHFTSSNSAMPSNSVMSLAINPVTKVVMIGTATGLVEYDENGISALSADYEDLTTEEFSGMTEGWTFHYAYSGVSEIAYANGLVYGLADGAIFSVDTHDTEVRTLSALTGLSSSGVGHIVGDPSGRLLIAYRDGNMDIIKTTGEISNMTDLKRKQLPGVSKLMHDVTFHAGKAYMAMDFGVLVINMQKEEIADWYLPTESGYPFLQNILVEGDSIYAASEMHVYSACLKDNLVDFAYWKKQLRSQRTDLNFFSHFCGTLVIDGCTYKASGTEGITCSCNGSVNSFLPDGPAVNKPYRMTFLGDKMVMVPGGRWTTQYQQNAYVMIYEQGEWHNVSAAAIREEAHRPYVMDFTRAAIDPLNPEHYFISSYGFGLYEFENDHIKNVYMQGSSPLVSAVPSNPEYTRVDGVTCDADGNVWMLNAEAKQALVALNPSSKTWASMSVANGMSIPTPGDVLIDANRPNYKWLVSSRNPAGLALYDDRGTPFQTTDDQSVFRSSFVDDRGKVIAPDQVRCIVQDRKGLIWLGLKEGMIYFSPSTDFFKSNRCSRIIINRTDGSDLGDYMLGTEQINAIAVDGGNRLWVATASSGVYLMDVDMMGNDTKTVYHFTTTNSPLPSDNVNSVAIHPVTGEVFFGTEAGLVSFRSDASEPDENYDSAYVFPNPVRPNYQGLLTIRGLMEDSSVKIADSAGNLVYTCTSNGGTAVWNMKGMDGRRVRPGVYVIYCNSAADVEDSQHKALKVLIM